MYDQDVGAAFWRELGRRGDQAVHGAGAALTGGAVLAFTPQPKTEPYTPHSEDRDGDEDPDDAKDFAAEKNGKDHQRRGHVHAVADDTRRQDTGLDDLDDQECGGDAGEKPAIPPGLTDSGGAGRGQADSRADVGQEFERARDKTEHDAVLEVEHAETDGV